MEKEKEQEKGSSKRTRRAFFGEEQAQDPEWWSEEDFAWRSKGKKDKRACQRGVMDFRRVVSALTSHVKVQARISSEQRQGRNQKGKGNESLHPESGLSASSTPDEEGYGHDWESDDRSSSQWLDDSWTSATGRYCTKAHTARMVAPLLTLANHPTHVVLDLRLHTVDWIKSSN